MEQKVKTIVITHKDRFIRLDTNGFERFHEIPQTILVVNNEELSPQEELVQDIGSIPTVCFPVKIIWTS